MTNSFEELMKIYKKFTGVNIKEHNINWPQTPDHPYRILIIRGSISRKTNTLINLVIHQPGIDKIYLYIKDPYETRYQLLINKCKSVGSKPCNDPKVFIEYSNDISNIYENIDGCNRKKKRKTLIVSVEMTFDMLINTNFN